MTKIDILGTEYTLKIVARAEDPTMIGDGYVDTTTKQIVVDNMAAAAREKGAKGNLARYQQEVIRHEIIHAMLYESGLDGESWGRSEEIVDWMALQFPKIAHAVAQAEIAMGALPQDMVTKLP